jgi:hypothetical protein
MAPSLGEWVTRRSARTPDATALVDGSSGERISYRQLEERFACTYEASPQRDGDRCRVRSRGTDHSGVDVGQRSDQMSLPVWGRTPTSLGPARDSLIKKGLVCAPELGHVAYTVPRMADFIDRRPSG